VKVDIACHVNPKTSLFGFTTCEAAITGASMPPIGRDQKKSSLTSGGQTVTLVKKLTTHLLIIFDELSNAVCPSSLALSVTKIACVWTVKNANKLVKVIKKWFGPPLSLIPDNNGLQIRNQHTELNQGSWLAALYLTTSAF